MYQNVPATVEWIEARDTPFALSIFSLRVIQPDGTEFNPAPDVDADPGVTSLVQTVKANFTPVQEGAHTLEWTLRIGGQNVIRISSSYCFWDKGEVANEVRSALQKPLHLMPDDTIEEIRVRAEDELMGIFPCALDGRLAGTLTPADRPLLIMGIGLYVASSLAGGTLQLAEYQSAKQEQVKVGPITVTQNPNAGAGRWAALVAPYKAEAFRKMRRISCVASARRAGRNRPAIIAANQNDHGCSAPNERRRGTP